MHVVEKVTNTSISLLATGDDLVRGKDETVVASVAKLNGKVVGRSKDIGSPVNGATRGLIDGGADRAILKLSSMGVTDSINCTLEELLNLIIIARESTTRIPICCRLLAVYLIPSTTQGTYAYGT